MAFPRCALVCGVLLAAAAAARCTTSTPNEAEPEAPIPVVAQPVQLGNIRGVVSATGVVAALPGAQFVVISPQPGRVAEVTKAAGDPVKSGEVLVRFEFPSLGPESAALAAAVKAADLRLRRAQLVQEQLRGLLQRGAASQIEVDAADREATEADAEMSEARANQSVAEARKQNAVVRAPFNGIVAERLHNPGDAVTAADTDAVLRIADPRQVHLVASVAAADLDRFAVGASARAVTDSRLPPELLRVVDRPAAADGATTTPVTLAFDSPTGLAPGTQVGVEIDAEQRSNVPLVPAIAIVRDSAGNAALFVVAGGVARRRPVITGLADNEHVEIQSGIKPGEQVITQGLSDLRDGTPITVTQ